MAFALGLFAQGASLGFAAAVSPGPFLAYLIAETLGRGWRRTFPLIFVPLLSDIPAIILTVFILGQVPPWALHLIQVVGGLFVLYLAWGAFRQVRQNTAITLVSDEVPPSGNILLHGVAIAWLSPGLWIFWSTVNGPIVLSAWHQLPPAAFAFLVGFYGVMMISLTVGIMFFHQARRLDERIVRGLLTVSCVIMVIFAGLLLKSGLLP